ncbi:ABC transporter ATP-binding protein [Paenibacillus sp. P26]|nr:ABC transporter ATP-binding protein [Paenibacillus sp. P26]
MAVVQVERLGKSYGAERVLEELSFEVAEGEWLGILGPNGTGKSTPLQLISGVIKPSSGRVLLQDKPAGSYPRKALARFVAVLQQDALPQVGFTVREMLEMGRYPYQNWLGDEPADRSGLVERILDWLRLRPLADRTLDRLSGGERRWVALGKVMAQEPKLLLLDEPTTYLDIGYQLEMMDWVRKWRQESGLTVISVLHDLNLAAQYCGRLLLLHEGRLAGMGTPDEVIRPELLERVYGTRPHVLAHPEREVPQILLGRGRMD